jgi:hypothetical protein
MLVAPANPVLDPCFKKCRLEIEAMSDLSFDSALCEFSKDVTSSVNAYPKRGTHDNNHWQGNSSAKSTARSAGAILQ